MQLPEPNLGTPNQFTTTLVASLRSFLVKVQQQVNSISQGSVSAVSNAATAPPASDATVSYFQGDFILNSAPIEQGAAGAKYIILGWKCVASGKPGTWKQCRVLTGE